MVGGTDLVLIFRFLLFCSQSTRKEEWKLLYITGATFDIASGRIESRLDLVAAWIVKKREKETPMQCTIVFNDPLIFS